MVLITNFRQRPVCVDCELRDLSETIEDPKWKKFFEIDPALYRKSSFIRSIKRNYIRQGTLTEKQREMFLKVVSEGAEGKPRKTTRKKRNDKPQETYEDGTPKPDETLTL